MSRFIHPRAGGEQSIDIAVDSEIEMRDRPLRQSETLGDESPHRVVRHELVGAGLVEREHLGVGERFRLFVPHRDLAWASRARCGNLCRLLDRLGR